MRRNRQPELTVPQFRVLVILSRNEDMSLSALAEHLGLSLPAVSRMVDLLVKRRLMDRQIHSKDRRRVSLTLTRRGRAAFQKALAATEVALGERLRTLSPRELGQVSTALRVLSRVFVADSCLSDSEK